MGAYIDYPAEIVQQGNVDLMLDGGKQGFVANVAPGAKIVSEKKISLGQNPGREFTVSAPGEKNTLTARIYLVKNRLFMTGGAAGGSITDADVKKYLDSFKLTGA
jgi:hypothetical protein